MWGNTSQRRGGVGRGERQSRVSADGGRNVRTRWRTKSGLRWRRRGSTCCPAPCPPRPPWQCACLWTPSRTRGRRSTTAEDSSDPSTDICPSPDSPSAPPPPRTTATRLSSGIITCFRSYPIGDRSLPFPSILSYLLFFNASKESQCLLSSRNVDLSDANFLPVVIRLLPNTNFSASICRIIMAIVGVILQINLKLKFRPRLMQY